jgi:hypothetical protein
VGGEEVSGKLKVGVEACCIAGHFKERTGSYGKKPSLVGKLVAKAGVWKLAQSYMPC